MPANEKAAGPTWMVEASRISKTYDNGRLKVSALVGVDFRVAKGEMVAVMGPSGCGKTTLLNCLSGLDVVDEGTILIEGSDLTEMGDEARTVYRSERMGFIFQSFNLLPVLSAAENVELPLLVSGVKPRAARARAEAALEEVGLAPRTTHMPRELSGGEQQRVAVARSLVNQPAIIWADEPTGNLDSDTSDGIMRLLTRLNKDLRQTYVIVTHSPEVAGVCDRVVWMRNGAIEPEVPAVQKAALGGRVRRLRGGRR
jgi:putative ABC transport system ATP-binding protein